MRSALTAGLLAAGLLAATPPASSATQVAPPTTRAATTTTEPDPRPRDSEPADVVRTDRKVPRQVAGARSVLVLRVHWTQRAPAAPSATAVREAIGESSQVLRSLSRGRTSLAAPRVSPWLKVPGPGRGGCFYEYNKLLKQAVAAAKRRGIGVRAQHLIIYLPCTTYAAGLGELPGRVIWLFNNLSPDVIAHEVGHNLGLDHANSWRCRADGRPTALRGRCRSHEYGDPFELMGSGWGMSSLQLNRLGWLGQTRTLSRSGTVTLTSLSAGGSGIRGLQVRAPDGDRYWLDFRTHTGLDARSPWLTAENVTGVHVRLAHRAGSRLVDATPGSTEDFVLPPGSSLTTPERIRLTVTAQSATSATVKVAFGARPATAPSRPTGVTATPTGYAAEVAWQRPADNGAAITGYRVTAQPGNITKTVTSPGGTSVSARFGGLDAGTGYTFTVTALNEMGSSAASAPSAPVVPERRGLEVEIYEPTDGATIRGGTDVCFWVTEDPQDPEPMTRAELLVDGAVVDDVLSEWGDCLTWDGAGFAAGDHELKVRATDAAGTTTSTPVLVVTLVPLDFQVSTSAVVDDELTVTWSGTDSAALDSVVVEYYDEEYDAWWELDGPYNSGGGSATFRTTWMPSGSYAARVVSAFSWDEGYYEHVEEFTLVVP